MKGRILAESQSHMHMTGDRSEQSYCQYDGIPAVVSFLYQFLMKLDDYMAKISTSMRDEIIVIPTSHVHLFIDRSEWLSSQRRDDVWSGCWVLQLLLAL